MSLPCGMYLSLVVWHTIVLGYFRRLSLLDDWPSRGNVEEMVVCWPLISLVLDGSPWHHDAQGWWSHLSGLPHRCETCCRQNWDKRSCAPSLSPVCTPFPTPASLLLPQFPRTWLTDLSNVSRCAAKSQERFAGDRGHSRWCYVTIYMQVHLTEHLLNLGGGKIWAPNN